MTRQTFAAICSLWTVAALLAMPMAAAQQLTMPPTAGFNEPTPAGVESIPAGPIDMDTLEAPDGTLMAPDPLEFHGYNDRSLLSHTLGDVWGFRPALTESTGTWLRRGWWYTEIDGVVLNRFWKRDDETLGFDTASRRALHLNRSDPGASGSVRLTLGRFLFRDVSNRDHTLELSAFGGGEWGQFDTLSSSTGGQTLFVPPTISGFSDAFDGAQTMEVTYDSRMTSFELNYRVKERMRRDRMVLTPSGEWVRTANHGVTKQFLAGLRYLDMVDVLNWDATNVATFANEDGNYTVRTNNDAFGLQLGCSVLLEHDRWNLEIGGKGGPFVNDAKADSRLTITNDPDSSFVVDDRESALSFVGEFQLIGRYHLRPNLSLRAGWQMMYITNMALAPDQLDFSPDEGRFSYTGDPFFNGGIFGLESYW